MKAKFFAIAALAATTLFASCNKDNEGVNAPQGDKAKLTIGMAPTSRAAGNLTDNTDNVIGQFKAYVFAGDVLQVVMTSTDGTAVTNDTDVTTAANMVYVIANANAATELASIAAGTTNKSAFLAIAGNLISSDACAALTAGKVWASGSGAITFDTNNEATVSVSVVPVSARINVALTDSRTNLGSAGAFEVVGLKLLNVAGNARFIKPASYVAPSAWYTGYTGGDNTAATVTSYLAETVGAGGKNMYYAFENDGSAYPTIVAIEVSNGTDTRYFPVHFTAADAGCTVERGKSYQVAIMLTGSATDDPGIDDPEDEIVTGKLTVTVGVTNWVMVPISKEF